MKRAGPGKCIGHDTGICSENLRTYPFDATGHFGRGPAREGHQQDATRVSAVDDEMGDPMSKRVGLARPGPGDDEKGNCGRT